MVAEFAVGDHLVRLVNGRRVAVAQVDHVDHALAFRSLHHRHRLGVIHRERFLAEHMLPGANRLDRKGRVEAVGRRIDNGIDFAFLQHEVDVGIGIRNRKPGAEGGRLGRIHVTAGDDLAAGDLGKLLSVMTGDAASPDNRNTNHANSCNSALPKRQLQLSYRTVSNFD